MSSFLIQFIAVASAGVCRAIQHIGCYHIAVHNTLSLLLLRNAPPDEVCNAILVVLSLNSLATSIGFCVNWILHNK